MLLGEFMMLRGFTKLMPTHNGLSPKRNTTAKIGRDGPKLADKLVGSRTDPGQYME